MKKIVITQDQLEEAKKKYRERDKDTLKFISNLLATAVIKDDYRNIAQLIILQSKCYTYIKSNYNKAIEILLKVRKNEKTQANDYSTLAEIDFYLGINHQYLGNIVDAFINYKSSIKHYENITSISQLEELNIANALINISSLHKINDYEEYDKSDLNRALQIYKKYNSKLGVSNCYHLLSAYSFNNKNYNETYKYVTKALTLNIETNNLSGIAVCFGNIGSLYAAQGEFDKAYNYLKKSYEKIEPLKNDFLNALHDKNLGDYYQLKNDLKKAITFYRKALDFFENVHIKDQLLLIYKSLADIYAKTNQYKKAYQYLEKHVEIKKTSFKFDKVSAIYKNQKNQ